jgi:hypothetical protein
VGKETYDPHELLRRIPRHGRITTQGQLQLRGRFVSTVWRRHGHFAILQLRLLECWIIVCFSKVDSILEIHVCQVLRAILGCTACFMAESCQVDWENRMRLVQMREALGRWLGRGSHLASSCNDALRKFICKTAFQINSKATSISKLDSLNLQVFLLQCTRNCWIPIL